MTFPGAAGAPSAAERAVRRSIPAVSRLVVLVLVLLGAAFRIGRIGSGWSSWAVEYLSYYVAVWPDGLNAETALQPIGMHPPLTAALAVGLIHAGATYGALLLGQTLVSSLVLAAVTVWLWRRGGGAAAAIGATFLAFSRLQIDFSPRLDNYGLFSLATCCYLFAMAASYDDRGLRRLAPVVLFAALLPQTHYLGIPLVAFAAAHAAVTRRWRSVGAAGLGLATALPGAVVALRTLLAPAAFARPPRPPWEVLGLLVSGLRQEVGAVPLLASALLVAAVAPSVLRGRRGVAGLLACSAAGYAAIVLAWMGLGVATAEQAQYWVALGPMVALTIGVGRPQGSRRLMALVCALLALDVLGAACWRDRTDPFVAPEVVAPLGAEVDAASAGGRPILVSGAAATAEDQFGKIDPCFALLDPWRLHPFRSRAPISGRCGRYGNSDICFLPAEREGGELGPRVIRALSVWRSQGLAPLVIEVVQGLDDPGRVDLRGLPAGTILRRCAFAPP